MKTRIYATPAVKGLRSVYTRHPHPHPLSAVRQNRIHLDYIVQSHSSAPASTPAQFDTGPILTDDEQQRRREIYHPFGYERVYLQLCKVADRVLLVICILKSGRYTFSYPRGRYVKLRWCVLCKSEVLL